MSQEQPIEAFPLCWPVNRPRTQYRQLARFKTAFAKARDHIVAEVQRLGGRNSIISTNIELRRDGLPYASFSQPADPGVALYFTYKGKQMCFCCDRYRKAEDNMHAISLTISALRGIARWGTGDMMESAFRGFAALPAPEQPFQVLGIGAHASREEIDQAFKRLAMQHHPDRGGNSDDMARINAARDAMLGNT